MDFFFLNTVAYSILNAVFLQEMKHFSNFKRQFLSSEQLSNKPFSGNTHMSLSPKNKTSINSSTVLVSSTNHYSAPSLKLFQTSGWLYEISSLVMAALGLVVLICVLHTYENRPSPQWQLGITLNAIVSIVSTMFRASLMLPVARSLSQSAWIWFSQKNRPLESMCWYDAASRGPLGSVKLIWKLKFL